MEHTVLVQACFLLNMLQHVSGQGIGCEDGWFGSGCRMLCHCFESRTCDMFGRCPNHKPCRVPYFGSGCQYLDAIGQIYNQYIPAYLRDSDDLTCNTNAKATSVEVIILYPISMTWFRVVVNNERYTLNFTTTLNFGTVCNSERKFRVSKLIVDVTCDSIAPLNKITIVGTIAPYVCSIYVSKGRNLALRETTRQPSTYQGNQRWYGSANAVDGNTNQDLDAGSCTHTNIEPHGGWWGVNFSIPIILQYALIYNRQDVGFRLDNFYFMTYTGNNTRDIVLRGQKNIDVQALNIYSKTPITFIYIKQQWMNDYSQRILTLCEVEAFGDYVCPKGTYGLLCHLKCACNKTEVCNLQTGICAPGCPVGRYGFECAFYCSENCLSGLCEYSTGNCLQCIPGYTGDICNIECPKGQYGKMCLSKCSVGCNGTCNHIHGYCTCLPGFLPNLCTECEDSLYGSMCNLKCSDNCVEEKCDRFTGKCVECKDYYFPEICNDTSVCPPGFYGENCNLTCPSNCVSKLCQQDSGRCFQCIYEFVGEFCEDCPNTMHGYGCIQKCSSNCLDNICDQNSGRCSRCASGYSGDNCDENPEMPYWFLFLLLVGVLFGVSLYMQRTKPVHE